MGVVPALSIKDFQVSTGVGAWLLPLKDIVFDPLGAPFDSLIRISEVNTPYYIKGKCYDIPYRGKLRAALKIAAGDKEADNVMRALESVHLGAAFRQDFLRDWLLQYTKSEEAIGVVNANWQVTETGAGGTLELFKKMGSINFGFAINGNRSMWEVMADVIRANGGEVWTSSRATKILIEDETVKGFLLPRTCSKRVKLRFKLMPKRSYAMPDLHHPQTGRRAEFLPKSHQRRKGNAKNFPLACFSGIQQRTILPSSGIGFVSGSRIINWLLSPTLLCPELAPKGKHITYVSAWIPANPPWKYLYIYLLIISASYIYNKNLRIIQKTLDNIFYSVNKKNPVCNFIKF